MGSPGDRLGLNLTSQGFGVCGACSHQREPAEALRAGPPWHPPAHLLLLPCLLPGWALFWDANIHTLLEPQIKGGAPRLPLNGSFVQTEACEEVGPGQRGGAGRGAPYKDTCHPERPADDDVKAAPGGGRPPLAAGSCPLDSQETRALCVASAEGTTVLGSPQRPPLPWVRVTWARAVWSPRVAGTCPWAQRRKKQTWHGPGEGRKRRGGQRHLWSGGPSAQPCLPAANVSKVPTVCQALSGARWVQACPTRGQGGQGALLCQPLWGQRHPGACGWTGRPKRLTHIVSCISRAAWNKEVL